MRLIGSAQTKEQLIKLIKLRWYWADVKLNDDGSVESTKGPIDGLSWRLFKKRYRLEAKS